MGWVLAWMLVDSRAGRSWHIANLASCTVLAGGQALAIGRCWQLACPANSPILAAPADDRSWQLVSVLAVGRSWRLGTGGITDACGFAAAADAAAVAIVFC